MLDLTGYKLTFSDEFNTRSISQTGDGTTWADIRPAWQYGAHADLGFGYSSFVDPASGYDPFKVANGALSITAVPDRTPAGVAGHWESGLITTQGGFSQTYGYFEMRAQLANKLGAWDAFWLLPNKLANTLPGHQELDVVEHYGANEGGVYSALHTTDNTPAQLLQYYSSHPGLTAGYHTYGVDWQADTIRFYFDGQYMGSRATPSDMHGPMYMLANLATQNAVDNNPDAAGVPITMSIDYIRAFSKAADAVAVAQDAVSAPDDRDPGLYGASIGAPAAFVGQGPWVTHGGAGNDTIGQGSTVFDATSVVTVFGEAGNDTITLAGANTRATLTVYGGAGADSIEVANGGLTMIYGGTGAADPTDGADTIVFGGQGSWGVWGNAGADTLVQGARAFDATSFVSVFGGRDGDSITLTNPANLNVHFAVYGGENGPQTAVNGGMDAITVFNPGAQASTIIFGGQGAADPSDGDDTIVVNGSGGTITVFGNAGNDTINGTGLQDSTNAVFFGGRGDDSITLTNATTTGRSSLTVYGGEDADRISANGNGGDLTIYGGTGLSDSTDGSDTITLTGTNTGMILVFANGGADTVIIGATGTDAATFVQVFGGGGNDSISLAAQANGAQRVILAGNDGADVFTIAKGAGQSVTISDFTLGAGSDTLVVTGVGTSGLQATAGSFQLLQQALDAASNQAGAGKAAAVVFGGSAYVVLESAGNHVFDAENDQAIKLTGLTDLNGLVAATSIA